MEFSFDKGQRSPNTLNNKTKTESDPFAEARSQHQSASRPQSSSPQFSSGASSSESAESSAEDRLRKAIERNRQKQQMRDGGQQTSAQAAPQANMANDELARKRAEQEAQIRAQFEAQQRARQEAQLRAQYEEQQRAKEEARAHEAEKAQMQARQLAEAEARLRQAQAEQRARQESRNVNSAPAPEQGALFGERPTMMNRQAPPVQPEVLSARPAASSAASASDTTVNKEVPRESLAARLSALNKANAEAAAAKSSSNSTSRSTAQAMPQQTVEVDPLEKKISSKAVVTRQRVARVEDEFTTPVKKAPRKVTTPAYVNKKAGSLDPKWQNILVKGSWIFCGLMLVRLFFSQGGILDFYDQSKILTDKKLELEQIRSENMALTREISRMQNDTGYQKKIVRDNLGFIAQDEFLILFPKEI